MNKKKMYEIYENEDQESFNVYCSNKQSNYVNKMYLNNFKSQQIDSIILIMVCDMIYAVFVIIFF